jgi:hypothetical protein
MAKICDGPMFHLGTTGNDNDEMSRHHFFSQFTANYNASMVTVLLSELGPKLAPLNKMYSLTK